MIIIYNTNYSPVMETSLGLACISDTSTQMKSKRQRSNNNGRQYTFEEVLEKKKKETSNELNDSYVPIGSRLGRA